MRMGLRYGISLVMIVLGVYIIYHEYWLLGGWEGLFLGSLIILWGLMRALMWKHLEKRYNGKI